MIPGMFAAASRFDPAPDPHWANVVALLHLDSGISDETGRTWTNAGGASVSSAQSVFGGGSLRTGASSGWLSTADSAGFQFGTGDFTVECFARIDALRNYSCPLGNFESNTGWGFWFGHASFSSSHLAFKVQAETHVSAAAVLSAGEWFHLAASRESGVLRLFVDGAQVSSGSSTSNVSPVRGARVGCNRLNTDYFSGYVDEVRITKGVARYTGDFIPPTAPFPNF